MVSVSLRPRVMAVTNWAAVFLEECRMYSSLSPSFKQGVRTIPLSHKGCPCRERNLNFVGEPDFGPFYLLHTAALAN